MANIKTSVFSEGVSDCNSGKEWVNPYKKSDPRHKQWDDGYSRQRYFNLKSTK